MVVVIHPPATTQARILAQLHKVCVCAGIGYARLEGYGGTLKYVGYDAFERAAAAATGTECEVRQLRKAMEWVREDVEDKGSISMDEWLSELGERRELEGEWINWRPPSSV
ncbi:hypothetical protein Q8F55_000030 [Vanrija albida]|uniref:EF-hand domain-containing protein n=1 Tax=Vanrija albida TaxID=181172 RepID=A0ABR3QC34_9TREE